MKDKEIQDLIDISKQIHKREPKNIYKTERNHKRCDLILSGGQSSNIRFDVFIRQNQTFIENFSIGLSCKIPDLSSSVQLIRYNGPHDSRDNIEHHLKPHIHRITQEEIQSGNLKYPTKNIQITDKYNMFEEGLRTFLIDMKVTNWQEYFPELEQGRLF